MNTTIRCPECCEDLVKFNPVTTMNALMTCSRCREVIDIKWCVSSNNTSILIRKKQVDEEEKS